MIPRAKKCYKKTVDEFGDSDDENILEEICTVVDNDLTVAQTGEKKIQMNNEKKIQILTEQALFLANHKLSEEGLNAMYRAQEFAV